MTTNNLPPETQDSPIVQMRDTATIKAVVLPAESPALAPADYQLRDFVFRSTTDGILVADAQGILRQMNPAAGGMLAQSADVMLGQSVSVLFRNNPALLNLFIREGAQTLDVRLAKRRIANGVAYTLNDGQRVVLLQDVTEQRDLEARRESLIKTLAHDLRNPINAIGGYADLVSKFGPLNEQQTAFAQRIRQTTQKLYDVVESLVDLAWIESGIPLVHRPVEMNDVVQEAVKRVSDQAVAHKITIAIAVQDPLPAVMGDRERLILATRHLLQNAIIYSEMGGTIAIHAWGDDHDVYCSVADKGIGIADDELAQIFNRMYRANDDRVRDIAGGGLGLTLARAILVRHGGDIWASSNFNKGSTFTFMVPTVKL
jgi:signal transduction histidine kinase